MARKATVKWSRAIDLDQVVTGKFAAAEDYGIYMMVEDIGDGRGKQLIYVGIVKSSDRRTFFKRMQEHRKDWLHSIAKGQIWIKFGIIETYDKLDDQLIEDVESAIVFGAQPRENTAKKSSYRLWNDVEVTNEGQGPYLAKQYSTAVQRKKGTDPSWN